MIATDLYKVGVALQGAVCLDRGPTLSPPTWALVEVMGLCSNPSWPGDLGEYGDKV